MAGVKSKWVSVPIKRIHTSVLALNHLIQEYDCYIAGGYARWACSSRDDSALPKDIDVICPSDRKFNNLKNALLAGSFGQVRDGEFSITFKSPSVEREVQLLKPYRGNFIENCLEDFDVSICRVALMGSGGAIADSRYIEDESTKTLTVCTILEKTAMNTLMRLFKYANKGYVVNSDEVIKVLNQIKGSCAPSPETYIRDDWES